jgi:hypothetical protein
MTRPLTGSGVAGKTGKTRFATGLDETLVTSFLGTGNTETARSGHYVPTGRLADLDRTCATRHGAKHRGRGAHVNDWTRTRCVMAHGDVLPLASVSRQQTDTLRTVAGTASDRQHGGKPPGTRWRNGLPNRCTYGETAASCVMGQPPVVSPMPAPLENKGFRASSRPGKCTNRLAFQGCPRTGRSSTPAFTGESAMPRTPGGGWLARSAASAATRCDSAAIFTTTAELAPSPGWASFPSTGIRGGWGSTFSGESEAQP